MVDLVRMVATARILMPLSRVRLSAGRRALSKEAQILCFLAGANSIFHGDKLLTTANNDAADDLALIEEAGLRVQGHPLLLLRSESAVPAEVKA